VLNEALADSRGRGSGIYSELALSRYLQWVLSALVRLSASGFYTDGAGRLGRDQVLSDIVGEQLEYEGPLLRQIIELLPVGLTLRSQDGQLILCNAAATPNVSSTERTITSLAGNPLPIRSGATRPAREIVPLGEISRVEETASDGTAERTLWTSQR
jgi:hypothetical protein